MRVHIINPSHLSCFSQSGAEKLRVQASSILVNRKIRRMSLEVYLYTNDYFLTEVRRDPGFQ